MLNLPYIHNLWPLYLLKGAFTIWMLTDVQRRGLDYYWFYIILLFQPLGPWIYFFLYKACHLQVSGGWLAGLLTRPASLDELYHRAEQSPMPAAWLDLGAHLVQLGKLEEARPYLERVVAREPEHSQAQFLLATCHRGLGQPGQAVPFLQRVVHRQPNWGDYKAWHTLIEVLQEAGDLKGAADSCRNLARVTPSLENRCLQAELLMKLGETIEARKVVEQGLTDFQYATGASRRRDRRWVGRGRELLRQMG